MENMKKEILKLSFAHMDKDSTEVIFKDLVKAMSPILRKKYGITLCAHTSTVQEDQEHNTAVAMVEALIPFDIEEKIKMSEKELLEDKIKRLEEENKRLKNEKEQKEAFDSWWNSFDLFKFKY